MTRQGWIGAAGVLLFVATGFVVSHSSFHFHREPATEETVRVEQEYVTDRRLLTVTCMEASHGACRVAVRQGDKVRTFPLRRGEQRRLPDTPSTATTCVGGRVLAVDSCDWQRVTGGAA